MTVTFLLKLGQVTGNDAIVNRRSRPWMPSLRDIVPAGRWEDFETYWSCSVLQAGPTHRQEGRAQQHAQADATSRCSGRPRPFSETYQVTKDRTYLERGQRVLDELLMTQASWQPPYMYVNVLGGFGVMNCDGEWNDSTRACSPRSS